MSINRRDFIRLSTGTAASTTLLSMSSCAEPAPSPTTDPFDSLKPMTGDIVSITVQEREARIAKAQRLMVENKIEALLLDAGTSMTYFTGVR